MVERDGTNRPNSTHTNTRRRFLAMLGTGAVSGIAGCGSGGGGDPTSDGGAATPAEGESTPPGTATVGDPNTNDDAGASGGATPTETTGDSDGASSGCPSPPSSYVRTTITPTGRGATDPPDLSVELPEVEYIRTVTAAGTAQLSFTVDGEGGVAVGQLLPGFSADRTVEEEVSRFDGSEVTSEFDFEVDGTRAVSPDPDTPLFGGLTVFIPTENGVLNVGVPIDAASAPCQDLVETVYRRVVESMRPA